MSFHDRLVHQLLVKHPAPDTTADSTGQLFVDETGQPIGDSQAATDEFVDATPTRGLIQEMSAKWPEGAGAGPELVDTRIYLEFGTSVRELDKIQRVDVDPMQAYQVVYVNPDVGGAGHHMELKARRIPL